MAFISKSLASWPVVPITAVYALLIATIIAFIYGRRLRRAQLFARRDIHAYFARQNWAGIVSERIPVSHWRSDPVFREVVETMLLDAIGVANGEELPPLLKILRSSGLLDKRLEEARRSAVRKRRTALIALGQTRAPEAIKPLVAALDSSDVDVRTAAVRGLGAIGTVSAAVPILERLSTAELRVPVATTSTALVSCCQHSPDRVLKYFWLASGPYRELLARVLAETELEVLGEELISLANDPNPEVRACAARGLAKLHPSLAIPALISLSIDEVWFVRLRAVIALGSIASAACMRPLLQSLCDPNRFVRQRAAAALVSRSFDIGVVIREAVALNDQYGLQALVSEIERTGETDSLIREMLTHNSSLGSAISNAREDLRITGASA